MPWTKPASRSKRTDSRKIKSGRRLSEQIKFERLEQRLVLANAVPATSLMVPAQALIGSTVNLTVGFSNTSPSQVGYGPYVDLEMPSVGSGSNSGLSFGSATYLGAAVTATVLTFDASGHVTHPYAKDSSGSSVVISGTPGDQLVVLQLPFGSFTPGQPEADINVAANLSNMAAVGSALTVKADGGFRYGNDARDNPATDPSIIGASVSSPLNPTLVIVKTTYLGPEQETATGPDFKQQYLVTATVAPGQTINNFDLTDILPAGEQFVSLDSSGANGSTAASTTAIPAATTPGGTLTRHFDKIVGTGGATDASMKFTFYVPRDDASGNPVLNLTTGAFVTETNQAQATGTWTPLNPNQTTTSVASNTATDTIAAKSVAIQEGVTDLTNPNSPTPGDVLQYTISFQGSDFFGLQSALASEVFSDGQHFDTTFTPTLQYSAHGATSSANIASGNYTVGAQNTSNGTTPVAFRLASELLARAISNGLILGGSIPSGGTGGAPPSATPTQGAATGTIVFRTVIQQQFDYNHPVGAPYVVEGDLLTSSINIAANVDNYGNLSNDGSSVIDGSGASVVIPRGSLVTSIYAINGDTNVGSAPKIAAGDVVTYRLQYTLPTSNIDSYVVTSYAPLPVFDATTVTRFDDVTSSTAPAAGHAQFGPNDTFRALSGIVPTLATDGTANDLTFTYGNYHDPNQRQTVTDILYSVTASSEPFADGLFLTTQANETEGSTNNGSASANALVQIKLTEPVLAITKGVVATDNSHSTVTANPYGFSAPGSSGYRGTGTIHSNQLDSNPITGTITNFDAGDRVTFAVVVQNTGTGLNGAYDVTLKDILPSGFVIPSGGLNLSVTDGTGATLSVSNVGGGSGLFDQGILIKNSNAALGTLAAYNATSGKNILVLTYDLQAADSVTPNNTITNTASLTNYSATEGGPDFLTSPATATASATTAPVGLVKAITATSQAGTTGSNLAIGEIATYTVTLTLPEGITPGATLVDTLPSGLAIVAVDSITPSSSAVTSSEGSWSSVLANHVTVASNGSSATFNLGDINDTDRDNSTTETLTIVYRVVALNTAGNQQGTTLTNGAALTYTGGSAAAAAAATVVVPKLTLTASANKAVVQAGDTVTYTFTVANLAGNGSGTNAYDVNLSDLIPTGLTYVASSLTNTGGTAPTSTSVVGNNVGVTFSQLALGATSTFTLQATVDSSTGPYQTLSNPFGVTYTTLPGTVTTPESSYSSVSTERTGSTGDPGGSVNNLTAARSVAVATTPPTISKTILGTNLSTTSGTNVAVGEKVQYQVTLTIPDGTTANAVLTDTLPAGLAVVSIDSITADSNLSTSVSGGFAAVASNASVTNNGGLLTLNFGTITNANRNTAQSQTIVVTYTTVVLNTTGNVANTALQNAAQFAVQGGNVNAHATAINVVLPVLKVTVAANRSSVQAGDTVTYTVTVANSVANASAADAYDVNLIDLLPSGLTYVANSFANTAGTAPTSISGSGSSPSATFSDLALGASSTFTFQATVDSSTGPYQTITDSATATYTTLPGTVTTPQSSYNSVSTERTGITSDPGGSANNLTKSGTAAVTTVLPALAKTVVGTSLATTTGTNVAIGEKVQYQVTVTVPDGTTTNATLTDSLPAGLAIVSLDGLTYSSTLSSSQSGGFNGVQSSVVVGSNGSSLMLNFGTINNSNRDTTQTQTIVVTYTAVVLNNATNTAGRTLTNSAVFAVQGGSTAASTPVTVVEPHVGVTLTASPTRGDAYGSAITFTAVITASAGTGADAYDTAWTDILPPGFTYVAGSLATSAGQAPSSQSDSGGQLIVNYADLAPGATSTITFQATPSSTTTPGQTVLDTATTTYTSLPGAVTTPESSYNTTSTERTGKTSDPGGSANTYTSVASAGVLVNSNTIAGTVFEDGNNDGTINTGEPGIANATVTLTGVDNLGNSVNLTTTTTASGAYSFTGLRPGSYALAMTPPSGYLDGKDTVGTPFGGTNPAPDHFSGLSIPLGTNAAGAGYNFGELRPASVAGKVFSDLNNNGAVEAGEPGISGVTLTLTGTDDLGNAVRTALTTDSNGNFSFGNLRPGTYTVAESQPSGYLQGKNAAGNSGGTFTTDTLASIVLTEGKADSAITYSELAPSTLTGTVYVDTNDDGVKQAAENGVGSVLVTLTGTDDLGNSISTSTATASSGVYSFSGLRPGTYAITEATPSGFVPGKAAAGSLGGSTPSRDVINGIPVTPNAIGSVYNLGILPPASLAGFVFVDANNDGIKASGEVGVGSATVTLTGTDETGATITQTATTASDGSYNFLGLEPGTYTVTATVPSGDFGGKAAAGSLGGNASVSDQVSAISVATGAAGTAYNLGVLLPSSLTGFVYGDPNDDGIKQGTEAGIANVTVALTGTDDRGNPVSRTTTTASDGSYAFATLRPGTYALAATTPSGYLTGKATAGTSGGTATPGTLSMITLAQGSTGAANNFGELTPASLAGVVFDDTNNDGTQGAGDAGISGVTITLTGLDDLGNSVTASTTTGTNGTYAFGTLRPGTYQLAETPPTSRLDGKTVAGSLGGTALTDLVSAINVGSGNTGTGYTFAQLDPAVFSGHVFRDDNNDATEQAGEPGIANVTLTLTGTDDRGSSVSRSTTSTSDGSYSFASLRPGTYGVTITPPSGYLDGKETVGSAGGSVGVHQISGATLTPATTATGYNFAELAPSTLTGLVYRDDSDNGTQEAGEPGISAISITLTGTDDLGHAVNLTTTSVGDGTFQFAGLRPSNASGYAVTSATPAGDLAGKVVAGSAGGTVAGRQVGGIVLTSNTAATGYRFAALAPSSLAGVVYIDPNNNGTPDSGEAGLVGASLTLTGTDDLGNAVALTTTTTTNQGNYAFGGLRPGTYAVTMTPPSGTIDGKDTAGSLGGNTATQNQIKAIVVPSMAAGTGYNFAELLPGTIAGTVYSDGNNDGSHQPTEPGRAGASITLTGTDDHGAAVNITTTSASDGSFAFFGLRPGTYALSETPPAAELDGHANPGTQGGTAASPRSITGITLGAGLMSTANDFGVLDPARVAGVVYVDSNNDGTQQAGEAGLANVALTLTGTNDLGQAVRTSTTTAGDGSFLFAGLRPGSYTVDESAPAGTFDGKVTPGPVGGLASTRQIRSIPLNPGTQATSNQFAALLPSSLAGVVYLDSNDDGSQQAAEPTFSGSTVTLTGTNDLGQNVSVATTTASNGSYQFASLRPGSYRLTETPPSGTLDGTDSLGSLGGTVGTESFGVTVAEGQAGTGYKFAQLNPASVAGVVFRDNNDDGIQQTGEAGLGGVDLVLTGTDDHARAVSIPLRTNADGSYGITSLRPGTYAVAITPPMGLIDGVITVGTAGGTAGSRQIRAIPLTSGVASTGNTFAELLPSSLAGYAYSDANDDGVRQASEGGLAGVTITLTGTDDTNQAVLLTTTTASDGSYAFGSVRPGTYALQAASPSGTLDGTTRAGSQGGTVSHRTISTITLQPGTNGTENDFASLAPNSFAGVVYLDSNADGTRETGEPGIANVTLTLTGTNDMGQSVMLTQTTSATGGYAFTSLRPGTYKVVETPPPGDSDGAVAAGSSGGTVGTHQVSGVVLTPGAIATGYDFGEIAPATLSGVVFNDRSDDGTQGAGEAGLANVVVTLTGTDTQGNAVTRTTTTASNGSYSLANLRPGTYGLTAAPPAGYLVGKTSGTDCDCSCPSGLAHITVAAGDSFADEAIGMVRPASLAGSVFFDLNHDSVRQSDESGQAGIILNLDGTDDLGASVARTTTTDATGAYSFTGLRPGRYALADLRPSTFSGEAVTVGTAGGLAGSDVVLGITTGSGSTGTGYNFALVGATVAGRVAVILGHGASLGSGVGGVPITLKNSAGTALATTTTASDGSYSFPDLPTGTYTLVMTTPSGYSNATPASRTAAVPLGGVAGQDFGLAAASLAGALFVDPNNNGLQDAGEAGLAGVTVMLAGRDLNGQAVASTTRTLGDGSFDFLGLLAGTYTVTVPSVPGYLDGRTTAGTLVGTALVDQVTGITVDDGSVGTGYDFGKLTPASISGFAYNDLRNTGTRVVGDPGIGGVAVDLTGEDAFGRPVSAALKTAADGSFTFGNLWPGTYTVSAATPTGYGRGPATGGPLGGTVGPNSVAAIMVGTDSSATANNFAAEGSDVSGVVYDDRNGSGTYAAGDPGVTGAQVRLLASDGQVIAAVVTAADGRYTFAGIPAGNYSVMVVRPNINGTTSTAVEPLVLLPGVAADKLFGSNIASSTIAGTVFADRLDTGVLTAGDSRLAGVAVTLAGTDALGRAIHQVATTDAAGGYAFANLAAGSYTVTTSTPSGFLIDRASPTTQPVTVAAGGTASASFGLLPASSLTGEVYLDANKTGHIDGKDFGVANVTVSLLGTNDLGQSILLRTITDADGRYVFANLRPGIYGVTRGASPALADGPSNVGSLGGTAAKVQLNQIALAGGDMGQNYDFAQRIKPGCILALPKIRAIINQGPAPAGPNALLATHFHSPHSQTRVAPVTHPRVAHYLPRLARRIAAKTGHH